MFIKKRNCTFCYLGLILFFSNDLYSQNIEENKISNVYNIEIIKFDSTKDYFVIYAISDERKFKIVTRKIDSACRNVFVKETYTVALKSVNKSLPIYLKGSNTCDIYYDWGIGNIIINESEWECDIFLTNEIFGLCYTKDDNMIDKYKKWLEENPIPLHSRLIKKKGNAVKQNKRKKG